MKKLGIDLGTNSLGWAILENDKFIDQGVLIFPEGINREKGIDALATPAAIRRGFRSARRNKFRRRLRKYHTLRLLIEYQMCPLKKEELENWMKHGIYPVDNQDFLAWVSSDEQRNPYVFRYRAVHEKLSNYDLGRVFYHLAQRRGFKSSRKDQTDEDDKSLGVVKSSIGEISAELAKRNCTLGEYFYELHQQNIRVRGKYTGRKEHYETEFQKIVEFQKLNSEFAEKIKNTLFFQRPLRPKSNMIGPCSLEPKYRRAIIGHPLFEEFRMLTFINTIRLDFNTGDKVPLTQEQRLAIIPQFYHKQKYFKFERIINKLYPSSRKAKAVVVRPEFNYDAEKSITSCSVSAQLEQLFEAPLYDWRYSYTDENGKNRVSDYQTAFDALTFFDDNDKLSEFARKRLGFSAEKAGEFIKIRIPDGNANYSLHVIKKILPFLRQGIELSRAVFLANLPMVMGVSRFEENQADIINKINTEIDEYQKEKKEYRYAPNQPNLFCSLEYRLKNLLEDDFKINAADFSRLYQHTGNEVYPDNKNELLPQLNLGMLRNPLVLRSLTVLRRFVNYLRKNGYIDAETKICIELARSVNDRNTRMAWQEWQDERQKIRKKAEDVIIEHNLTPSEDLIRKYILWQEQNGYSLYTGNKINISDLFSPGIEIEHTIPRSRSGDSSLENNTVCEAHYNREIKGNKIPSECEKYDDILQNIKLLAQWNEKIDALRTLLAKQDAIAKNIPADNQEGKARARQKMLVTKMNLKYWQDKIKTFTLTKDDLGESFARRQIVDTGIMTRHALSLLRSTYKNSYAVNGRIVDWVRKAWGIQSIYESKNREDHTHHAIDAMMIAVLDRKMIERISYCFKVNETQTYGKLNYCPPDMAPWKDFRQDVLDAKEEIIIRHLTIHNECKQTFRQKNKLSHPHRTAGGVILCAPTAGDTVRGALHKETHYGRICDPHENGKMKFVVRYPLNSFTKESDIDAIVDPEVRKKVRAQFNEYIAHGISLAKAFAEPFWMKKPTADNPGVPIQKVRCATRHNELNAIRQHRDVAEHRQEYKKFIYAESAKDSNFMMAIYRQQIKNKIKYNMQILNIWEWATEHKKDGYLQLEKRNDQGEFVTIIQSGVLCLAYQNSPEELKTLTPRQLAKRLYQVVRMENDGRISLLYHREARAQKDLSDSSQIDFENYSERLRLSLGNFMSQMIIEGIHFDVDLCGKISFKF